MQTTNKKKQNCRTFSRHTVNVNVNYWNITHHCLWLLHPSFLIKLIITATWILFNALLLRLNLGTEMVSCHMLPMMASLRILQFSTVCRWGTEQPQSSFGLIFILFSMKIAGGHHHGSQGKSPSPSPMAHSDSHEVLMLYLQKSPRNKLLLLLSDESC